MRPDDELKRKKAKTKRGTRRAKPSLDVSLCQHPTKARYPSKADAKLAIRRSRGKITKTRLHAYRCPCGAWHVGHSRRGVPPPPA